MNKDIEMYTKFCTGCGMCSISDVIEFERNSKGFSYPKLTEEVLEFCEKVCPASGINCTKSNNSVWGYMKGIYLGWAKSPTVRCKGSSGGSITGVCSFLLESKLVDGIIQTKSDLSFPYRTCTVISRTKQEVEECSGSRYAISTPLLNIKQLLCDDEKYAFVGKPCDVAALRNYMSIDKDLDKQIVYLLSFFCAGMPSEQANMELLSRLKCNTPSECKTLQYRGNGWPGFTVCEKCDGEINTMTYNESWGNILGRDIRYSCRFCLDGIGEQADISCGDAWYLDKSGNPDFSEHEGRNVIITRTDIGEQLLRQASEFVEFEEYKNYKELYKSQEYQVERKATMRSVILALKLHRKVAPKYKYMSWHLGEIKLRRQVKRFVGTCKRIIEGKV